MKTQLMFTYYKNKLESSKWLIYGKVVNEKQNWKLFFLILQSGPLPGHDIFLICKKISKSQLERTGKMLI